MPKRSFHISLHISLKNCYLKLWCLIIIRKRMSNDQIVFFFFFLLVCLSVCEIHSKRQTTFLHIPLYISMKKANKKLVLEIFKFVLSEGKCKGQTLYFDEILYNKRPLVSEHSIHKHQKSNFWNFEHLPS